MDLSRDVEDFVKESIDHTLGLPISMDGLQKKLCTAEESQRRLREQYMSLVIKLKEKDEVIERVRSEASMNAQALKKFVEENQKLAGECESLVKQCKKWERECLLYHKDREALMDFGNECDERAREAETRVRDLEEQVKKMSDEMKRRVESDEFTLLEEDFLLDSVLASFVSKDETILGRIFLEANIEDKSCQNLLSKWDGLKPSMQKVVSLVSMVKKMEKEKECLILNLVKAEQEVELVSKQNRELDKENRKLLKQCSSSIRSAERMNSNKRKSPNVKNSPIEKKIDFSFSPGSIDS